MLLRNDLLRNSRSSHSCGCYTTKISLQIIHFLESVVIPIVRIPSRKGNVPHRSAKNTQERFEENDKQHYVFVLHTFKGSRFIPEQNRGPPTLKLHVSILIPQDTLSSILQSRMIQNGPDSTTHNMLQIHKAYFV